MSTRPGRCLGCHGCGTPCRPRVRARRVLVRHLTDPRRQQVPFEEQLAGILDDLAEVGLVGHRPVVVPEPRAVPEPEPVDGDAARIRAARLALRLTQRELAAAAGTQQSVISAIERGVLTTGATIAAVLAVLDLTPET